MDERMGGGAAWLSHKRHFFYFCKERWLNGLTLGFLDARILVTRVTKGVKSTSCPISSIIDLDTHQHLYAKPSGL